MPKIKALTV